MITGGGGGAIGRYVVGEVELMSTLFHSHNPTHPSEKKAIAIV